MSADPLEALGVTQAELDEAGLSGEVLREDLRNKEALPGEEADHGLGAIPPYPTDVLPKPARELVQYGQKVGLPAALVGGGALAALGAAIGGRAQVEIMRSWHERAILWVPLLAPRGAGKSPSQDLAFAPLRDRDAQLGDEEWEVPILQTDTTLEALARSLAVAQGSSAIDLDELAVLLRGLGEYKRGQGADRGRFLALWSSGAHWSLTRVGGGKATNAVRLRIPHPTLVICGGLQPALHELLGGEEDGLRPRWLPHLAPMPDEVGELADTKVPVDWQLLLCHHLATKREVERTHKLTPAALREFRSYSKHWKTLTRKGETASNAAALVKADVHLARVALDFIEAEAPVSGEPITSEIIGRAALYVDFTLGCWHALPEQGSLALSRRDWMLDKSIVRLVAWLEEHEGQASSRELQRARVAGVRTPADFKALLERYEAVYPGSVLEERPPSGGLPTVVVKAPVRSPFSSVSPSGDSDRANDEKARGMGGLGGVAGGDTGSGDTGSGDTAEESLADQAVRWYREREGA
jgi:Protein of unknown function (DUF3987)